jgi:hypothetical protein
MVKLTKILKNEFRDDVVSKHSNRGRRHLRRNRSSRSERDQPPPPPPREEVELPPDLFQVLKSRETAEVEKREEPAFDNAPIGKVTRAASLALRSLPIPGEEEPQIEAGTLALIDSIVKGSDDPALLQALTAMMDENEKDEEHRETLALVAESILEKQAAKAALERAVKAETRLQESLKKVAPDLIGDAATIVSDAGGSLDADAAPILSSNPPGFFNRMGRDRTSAPPTPAHRRIPFVPSRTSKGTKGDNNSNNDKSKNKKAAKETKRKTDSPSAAKKEDPPSDQEQEGALEEREKKGKSPPKSGESNKSRDPVEKRDDEDQAASERNHNSASKNNKEEMKKTAKDGDPPEKPKKRRNKYRHIKDVEPEIPFTTTSSSSADLSDDSSYDTESHSSEDDDDDDDDDENERSFSDSTLDEIEEAIAVEVLEEAVSMALAGDPTRNEDKKTEYTLFELESKVSASVCSSIDSFISGSASSSHDDDEHHEDEDSIQSERSESEDDSESESDSDDDDDNSLLFASFCHKIPSADEYENPRDDKRGKSRRSHDRKKSEELEGVPFVLKYVSGYFVQGDETAETFLDDTKRRRSRRRSC